MPGVKYLSVLIFSAFIFPVFLFSEPLIIRETEDTPDILAHYLTEYPVNLNTAPVDSLLMIPGFDHITAGNIIENRPFRSVNSALVEAGFSPAEIINLIPYLTVSPSPRIIPEKVQGNFSSWIDYGNQPDVLEKPQPWDLKTNLFLRYRCYQTGWCFEQDRGEQKFPDLINGYIEYQGTSFRVLGGTQQIKAGAGLLLGQGQFGLRLFPASLFSTRGYSGSTELGLPLGLFTQYSHNWFNSWVFAGVRFYDAILDSNNQATSLNTQGVHVSDLEIQRSRNFRTTEIDAGLYIPAVNAGVLVTSQHYSHPLLITSSEFASNQTGFALLFKPAFHNTEIFGELAKISTGPRGGYLGVLSNFNKFRLLMAARHYQKDFYLPTSNPPSETRGENEEGIYLEVKTLYTRIKFSTFFNYSREVVSPSSNWRTEIHSELSSNIELKTNLSLSYRFQSKKGESSGFPGIYPTRHQIRIDLQNEFIDIYYLKCIATDSGFYNQGDAVAVQTRLNLNKFSLGLFGAAYQTDSYASRVYLYKPGLPQTINYIIASGEGSFARLYLSYQWGNYRIKAYTDFNTRENFSGVYIHATI
ncbi:MAG: ComEA family DNA-binding protein [bacterium]